MKAKVVNKTLDFSLLEIIKYQINLHCFMNKIRLSPAQLECLGLLGLYGEINMSDFCSEVVAKEIFGNVQTTRNFITKCIKSNLTTRSGLGNKNVSLNSDLNIQNEGTILLNLKLYHVEAN
jgi:hypothetical protein|tara:strand:+ start:1066 stop:1428 length:363 start_codon:yes stop_codon:yes gene_type:complete